MFQFFDVFVIQCLPGNNPTNPTCRRRCCRIPQTWPCHLEFPRDVIAWKKTWEQVYIIYNAYIYIYIRTHIYINIIQYVISIVLYCLVLYAYVLLYCCILHKFYITTRFTRWRTRSIEKKKQFLRLVYLLKKMAQRTPWLKMTSPVIASRLLDHFSQWCRSICPLKPALCCASSTKI